MGHLKRQSAEDSERNRRVWALVRAQHGVVAHRQLVEAGYTREAVKHRLGRERLHRKALGVYAVGRPGLSRHGELMVAVLACGDGTVLSHLSAAELLGLRDLAGRPIEVSVFDGVHRRVPDIRVHRRAPMQRGDTGTCDGIPVTSPAITVLDLALRSTRLELERMVNLADALDLVDPEALRTRLDGLGGRPGVRVLRTLLDRHTFRLTDSVLEQRFLALAGRAGLPTPDTQHHRDGFRVDFVWPDLGLIVETDSWRYHRTSAAQDRDSRRDHAHFLSDRVRLRFSHAQITREAGYVIEVLRAARDRAAATGRAPAPSA
jgi:very-short-patch-repair endonuclease